MGRWYRVFGASAEQPRTEAVLEHLRGLDVMGPAHFRGDEDGWTSLQFSLAEGASPVLLECFLSSEDGIRTELNTWAAWLETCGNSQFVAWLMERIIQTRQLYTLCQPLGSSNAAGSDDVCNGLCRFLAEATGGIYQLDGEGFLSSEGTLLLKDD